MSEASHDDLIHTLGRLELVKRSRLRHRQPMDKPIGLLTVDEVESAFAWSDPANGFELEPGTTCLEMHLPPNKEFGILWRELKPTLKHVARYLVFHDMEAKYVMGLTHLRLGRLAARYFGFSLTQPAGSCPPGDVLENIQSVYVGSAAGRRKQPMGDPVIIFQERQAFVEHHLSRGARWGYRGLGFLHSLC